MRDKRDRVEEFERTLKAWAERPPRLSPERASRRTVEAVQGRRRRALATRTVLATAALLAVVVTLGVRRDHTRVPPEAPPPAASPFTAAPLRAGQALIWLDAETPLYMTFDAPETAQGGLP